MTTTRRITIELRDGPGTVVWLEQRRDGGRPTSLEEPFRGAAVQISPGRLASGGIGGTHAACVALLLGFVSKAMGDAGAARRMADTLTGGAVERQGQLTPLHAIALAVAAGSAAKVVDELCDRGRLCGGGIAAYFPANGGDDSQTLRQLADSFEAHARDLWADQAQAGPRRFLGYCEQLRIIADRLPPFDGGE